ncbi:hypothetical protein BDZ88DRAFT_441543 [Geranomyces variabilis]|nr:hypothetical protein BDZ88DRAFT_441543 [Geranomyces variabilis]KAJ3138545.1 hypothetical protein HDU90_000986 [Geranomyces variabilis]
MYNGNHNSKTQSFDEDNIYLKPVKWDSEAETLLFKPIDVTLRRYNEKCSKCLAKGKDRQQLFGEEGRKKGTLTGRSHAERSSSEKFAFEGWAKAGHRQLRSCDHGYNTCKMRAAWIDAGAPCIYRERDANLFQAIKCVYEVIDVDEYLTTGAEDSFSWILHGFVSAYIPPPALDAKLLRELVAVWKVAEEHVPQTTKSWAFFADFALEKEYRKTQITLKRNDCAPRTADIVAMEMSNIHWRSSPIAVRDFCNELTKRYLQSKGLRFKGPREITEIGLPHVSRQRAHNRSLYLLPNDIHAGSSQLERLFSLPQARACLLSYISKPCALFTANKRMWQIGMSIGLVDWFHAFTPDDQILQKAVKWVNWELSSYKGYSHSDDCLSEEHLSLLVHFILTPGAIAEVVRREITDTEAGEANWRRESFSWILFELALENQLDDMEILLALGLQALSADCWKHKYPEWPFWRKLMRCGPDKVKALLRDRHNNFRPESWDLKNLALDAVSSGDEESVKHSYKPTAWRVLFDLELLGLDTDGEDLLNAAIYGQNDICIEDLLERKVTSNNAMARIFSPASYEWRASKREPNMALFKRIVNDPPFYTAQSWAAAVALLVELPLESADRREALELLVSRPLLAAPTGELIMGLIELNEAEPGNSASALLPQIIETAGNGKIRRLVHEYWEYSAKWRKRQGDAHIWFTRLTKNTLALHKYGISDLFPLNPFVQLGACYAGQKRAATDMDWIARGLFHDVDERGHSNFAEAVLKSMQYDPATYSCYADHRLDDHALKLLAEHPIRINDRYAFMRMLVSLYSCPKELLYKLLHDDVNIRMMSETGEYDIRLSALQLVSAAIMSGADLCRLIAQLVPDEYLQYNWQNQESSIVEASKRFLVGGLVWIADALEWLAVDPLYATKRAAVKQETLIKHISEYLDQFTRCYKFPSSPWRSYTFKDIPVAERPSVLPIAVAARKCNWLEVGEFCEKLEEPDETLNPSRGASGGFGGR